MDQSLRTSVSKDDELRGRQRGCVSMFSISRRHTVNRLADTKKAENLHPKKQPQPNMVTCTYRLDNVDSLSLSVKRNHSYIRYSCFHAREHSEDRI